MSEQTRRTFLHNSVAVTAGVALASGALVGKEPPANRVRVGIMGAGGRALSLINTFSANANVEVVAIADLDPGRLSKGLEAAEKLQGKKPKGESDFR